MKMKFLALSGSGRKSSTNTAMLRAVVKITPLKHDITVLDSLTDLPVLSPDFETGTLPMRLWIG
jgi:chromate reductase